jgi:hypothetical protein
MPPRNIVRPRYLNDPYACGHSCWDTAIVDTAYLLDPSIPAQPGNYKVVCECNDTDVQTILAALNGVH